jgi:dihydroflavonol-4-reductase
VGPSFIGPGFSSGEAISIIMNSVYPGVPKIMMPTVDVRETAQAHLEALKRPEAANQRFILSNETIWF